MCALQFCAAVFLVPDWGMKPDMGAGRYDHPTPYPTSSPSQGLGIGPLESIQNLSKIIKWATFAHSSLHILTVKKITKKKQTNNGSLTTFGHMFSFKAGNGIQRTESGRLVGGVEQTVQGQWEYLDPDGKVRKIRQTRIFFHQYLLKAFFRIILKVL